MPRRVRVIVRRMLKRRRIIKKIGLDTSILVVLLDDKQEYSDYEPTLFRSKNLVFICQLVFNEAKGVLIRKGMGKKEAVKKILDYLHKHNIKIIKPKDLDKEKVDSTLQDLFSERRKMKTNLPEDPDLKIMAVYKSKDIDCIVTLNKRHFERLCNYLGLELEVPESNLDGMMRGIFGWRKRN